MGLVASLNRGLHPVECNPGQVANTHVPLSPSSIIWYQPTGLAAGKVTVGLGRTGHTSQTLVVLHLRAQGLEEGDYYYYYY